MQGSIGVQCNIRQNGTGRLVPWLWRGRSPAVRRGIIVWSGCHHEVRSCVVSVACARWCLQVLAWSRYLLDFRCACVWASTFLMYVGVFSCWSLPPLAQMIPSIALSFAFKSQSKGFFYGEFFYFMNPSPMLALRVYVCAMSGRGRQPAQVQVSSFQLQNQSPWLSS